MVHQCMIKSVVMWLHIYIGRVLVDMYMSHCSGVDYFFKNLTL